MEQHPAALQAALLPASQQAAGFLFSAMPLDPIATSNLLWKTPAGEFPSTSSNLSGGSSDSAFAQANADTAADSLATPVLLDPGAVTTGSMAQWNQASVLAAPQWSSEATPPQQTFPASAPTGTWAGGHLYGMAPAAGSAGAFTALLAAPEAIGGLHVRQALQHVDNLTCPRL